MRVIDLFEAPISNYEVHGMEQPGSFPDVDRRNLPSQQHIEKVKKRFADTEHNFSLYFANMAGKNYLSKNKYGNDDFTDEWRTLGDEAAGLTSPEMIRRITGVAITPDPSAISVVFISNANIERSVSMTPWIMAHRIGHALTDRIEGLPANMGSLINKLPQGETTVAMWSTPRGAPKPQVITVIAKEVLTMRSARTGNLNPGEEREELIAQFLMRGSIDMQLHASHAPEIMASINAQLNQKCRQTEKVLYQILDMCVGHIFLAI